MLCHPGLDPGSTIPGFRLRENDTRGDTNKFARIIENPYRHFICMVRNTTKVFYELEERPLTLSKMDGKLKELGA